MSLVRRLQTLEQVQRTRRASPKVRPGQSRRDVNGAKDAVDEAKLAAWRTKVYTRDRHHCRDCKRKVVRTLKRVPEQAQAHHIVGRADHAVRYDRRNGVTLCGRCHDAVERNEVAILGSEQFTVDGRAYVNGDSTRLTFVKR